MTTLSQGDFAQGQRRRARPISINIWNRLQMRFDKGKK
jgi:hypothetical protein